LKKSAAFLSPSSATERTVFLEIANKPFLICAAEGFGIMFIDGELSCPSHQVKEKIATARKISFRIE
jgi:hypothetical protein